jgi:hypothetical protein
MSRAWVEYWVSEVDEFGDIIDYTAQTFAAEDRGGVQARAECDASFKFDEAKSKDLERVESTSGESGERLDREYTTIASRTR